MWGVCVRDRGRIIVAVVGALVGLHASVARAEPPQPAQAADARPPGQIDALRAAAKASPGDAAASLSLGRALRRAGYATEALDELRRGSLLPAGRAGETGIALRWEAARAFLQRREFEPAMASCRSAGKITGGEQAGHACAAEAHLLLKRATDALTETSQALAGDARFYEAKVAEGLAHELEVKDADAEASFRTAIGWRPDAPLAHAWLGRLLVRDLKHDDGVAELRRAVQLDPSDPEANFELSQTLPAGPEAEGLLQRAVQERPSYVLALLRLANVELELGKLPLARAAAASVIRYDPREPAADIVAGRIALAEGHPDDAIRSGQAALALLANSARARLLIADAYAKKGEVDLAVESYEAAYGLDHADPTPLVRASEACHREGRETSARAFGDKATKEFPRWGPAWVAYGDALAGDREPALARAAYQSALKATGPVDAAAVEKKLAALK